MEPKINKIKNYNNKLKVDAGNQLYKQISSSLFFNFFSGEYRAIIAV